MSMKVLVWDARLENERHAKSFLGGGTFISGAPQFLAVVGPNGGRGRSKDAARYGKTANYGSFPAVLDVLKNGKPVKDIWLMRGNSITVSIVPVRAAGDAVLGAVVLGYNLAAAANEQTLR